MFSVWFVITGLFLLFGQCSHAQCGVKTGQTFKQGTGNRGSHSNFPWAVAVVYMRNNRPSAVRCSGTLISNQHVVTAAHCLYNEGTTFQTRSVHVAFGDDIRNPIQVIKEHPTIRYINPKFDPSKTGWMPIGNMKQNIAIILLEKVVPRSSGIPICIKNFTMGNNFHTGYGFGFTPYPNTQLYFYQFPKTTEYNGYLFVSANLPNNGGLYPARMCMSDAGGGFSYTDKNREYLMGVASTGPVFNCHKEELSNYQLHVADGTNYCDIRFHFNFLCTYAFVGCSWATTSRLTPPPATHQGKFPPGTWPPVSHTTGNPPGPPASQRTSPTPRRTMTTPRQHWRTTPRPLVTTTHFMSAFERRMEEWGDRMEREGERYAKEREREADEFEKEMEREADRLERLLPQ